MALGVAAGLLGALGIVFVLVVTAGPPDVTGGPPSVTAGPVGVRVGPLSAENPELARPLRLRLKLSIAPLVNERLDFRFLFVVNESPMRSCIGDRC